MNADVKIIERLEELVKMGERVLATGKPLGPNYNGDAVVEPQLAYQWATSTASLLKRVFGTNSETFLRFKKETSKFISYSPAVSGMGILKSALDDFRGGYLFDVRQLIQAEVFDEFLEQAEHLLQTGYHQPAAVAAGCVLEDGLRKLCGRNEVEISDKPKLDRMNADLAKAGLYNKLKQKQITAFADLRNKAAHGQWDAFTADDVTQMIAGIRSFMETHFA